jgi:ATP-dependent helicase HepA
MTSTRWQPGDRLVHRLNPDLGPGRVTGVSGRTLTVLFPFEGTSLDLIDDPEALAALVLRPGQQVVVEEDGSRTRLQQEQDDGDWQLEDGRVIPGAKLWPLAVGISPVDRLATGEVDKVEDFANRLDALHLQRLREARGLGSFLGGRIRLFPHQLYAAEQATAADPVRWLLADEVGLGKTVEACLVLNRLLHTGRADRVLVVAPDTLTVQWLGELWRKYHQVFVLMDEDRLEDVNKEYGQEFNPFDAYPRVVISLDMLVDHPRLTQQAVEADIDLLVVDEAHHLRRPPGHPGNPAWRAVAPIAALNHHTLLLSATPLEEDAHGFLRLVQLLHPEAFPGKLNAQERLATGEPLPPCTTSTRRADIGGLPPRRHEPVVIEDTDGWSTLAALVETERHRPVAAGAMKRKVDRVRRALSSPAALAAVLTNLDGSLRDECRLAAAVDPRTRWLSEQAPAWKENGDKTLIFVADRETLIELKTRLETEGRVRVGVFHEDLAPGQRDIEVAHFRLKTGPSIMISTECGGEGRNFEFCHRLVLFDLPWNPVAVEQRIGRLDRIGRDRDVEIVTFQPPDGLAAAIARLYAELGLYEEPLGGLDRELNRVEAGIRTVALTPDEPVDAARFVPLVQEVREARARVRDAAYHELHREPYRTSLAASILERVPLHLDELNEEVVTGACQRLGFEAEEERGEKVWSVEFGSSAVVDHLPGVAAGAHFLGTFDRAEAVTREDIDYFASGHPLVEGVLAELEDGPRGRAVLLEVDGGDEAGFGLLALYQGEEGGDGFSAAMVDAKGRPRDDWAQRLTTPPLRTRRIRPESWTGRSGWQELIEKMAAALPGHATPDAVAAVRFIRRKS